MCSSLRYLPLSENMSKQRYETNTYTTIDCIMRAFITVADIIVPCPLLLSMLKFLSSTPFTKYAKITQDISEYTDFHYRKLFKRYVVVKQHRIVDYVLYDPAALIVEMDNWG